MKPSSQVPPPIASPGNLHPSGDKRFQVLEVAMKRHQYRGHALIEVLHTAQELFGYLENDVLLFVARRLKLPPSKVYGVATFYHFFSLKPGGKHSCVVCMGTACFVKGSQQLVDFLERSSGVRMGETTPDGLVSLVSARCLGACGIAPAVVVDGTVRGYETVPNLQATLKGWGIDGIG